ncbi:hypothetical protein OsJ_13564 [Oryza sativa Japonica Group]|uniref:Uncharacterized protein n=1 Tax=Oryza sativa subsp. japonica TaxID=39947 RepID=A3AQ99_ORYSJ|nr:hypothetical protein OsJ_13564 [Oryza sativa Japonica Group]
MDRRSSAPSSRRRKESLLVAEGLVWKNRGGVAMRGRQIGQRNFFNLSDPAQVWWRCPLPASGRHATTVAALAALSPDTMTHPLRLRPLPLQMLGRRRCLLGWRQLSDSRTAVVPMLGSSFGLRADRPSNLVSQDCKSVLLRFNDKLRGNQLLKSGEAHTKIYDSTTNLQFVPFPWRQPKGIIGLSSGVHVNEGPWM